MRNTNAGQISAPGDTNHLFPWKHSFLAAICQPNYVNVISGTWNFITGNWTEASSLRVNGGYGASQSTPSQNDEIGWNLPLAAGTYTISFYCRKSTNTGIITVLLDGVSIGTIDTYAASASSALFSITGIVVPASGVHSLHLKMASKNASSSGYALDLLSLDVTRTA